VFLSIRDRLLDGSNQKDALAVLKAEKDEAAADLVEPAPDSGF
jgi:hypothetical protein